MKPLTEYINENVSEGYNEFGSSVLKELYKMYIRIFDKMMTINIGKFKTTDMRWKESMIDYNKVKPIVIKSIEALKESCEEGISTLESKELPFRKGYETIEKIFDKIPSHKWSIRNIEIISYWSYTAIRKEYGQQLEQKLGDDKNFQGLLFDNIISQLFIEAVVQLGYGTKKSVVWDYIGGTYKIEFQYGTIKVDWAGSRNGVSCGIDIYYIPNAESANLGGFVDVAGNEISVGDTIVYTQAQHGKNLVIGKVDSIGARIKCNRDTIERSSCLVLVHNGVSINFAKLSI